MNREMVKVTVSSGLAEGIGDGLPLRQSCTAKRLELRKESGPAGGELVEKAFRCLCVQMLFEVLEFGLD